MVWPMLLILDGNSEQVGHEGKIGLFGEKTFMCDCLQSSQMPLTAEITEIILDVSA